MSYSLGIDVGSTTVKYLLCDDRLNIITSAYEPHQTKQPSKLLEMLKSLQKNYPDEFSKIENAYITGSGATRIAPVINAQFIQEVNAVVLAIEYLHPDVNSAIELGGQDAKIIHFTPTKDGKKNVKTSMNEKCASGTGATIEKCTMKVGLSLDELQNIKFSAQKLHHVAAKCGVFAETDVVNLLKSSIPSDEIMNSLADAIVMQNLTVLTKGETLKPNLLLLGGPNTYLPFLQECWRVRIAQIWSERGIDYDISKIEEMIKVPSNAQYYGAYGAIIFGSKNRIKHSKKFAGITPLETFVHTNRVSTGVVIDEPLVKSKEELDEFLSRYSHKRFTPPKLTKKTDAFLGIDGGSTSSKAVLIDSSGRLLFSSYALSNGNPIEDTIKLLSQIKESSYYEMYNIIGLGVTGYAGDVLEGALKADSNIIETIAHLKSAQHYFGDDIDIICDIGGQDIKVLFLQNNQLKNFRLSNQCSAGNGTLLQSMAKQFGVDIEDYAKVAFSATKAPRFNYGCAVFLDTDRVNFQKEGFSKEELFAGIAKVLPKNVWQYVVQAPNLSILGKHYVLQGGTQYNLAALKAQVDYIKSQVPDATINLHPYTGLAGAIGSALSARDEIKQRGYATFLGIDEAIGMRYTSTTNEETRCKFCSINCSRTFIDTTTPSGNSSRYIAGFACEDGTVESVDELKRLKAQRTKLQESTPNLIHEERKALFNTNIEIAPPPKMITKTEVLTNLMGLATIYHKQKKSFNAPSKDILSRRESLCVTIPRVLNIYALAPFFKAYLKALGIKKVLFSSYTNEKMYLNGARYGSVDSCYPAKVAQSHIYSLLFSNKKIDYIWFPSLTHLPNFVTNTVANTACPVVSGTPRVVYATFAKNSNLFDEKGIDYVDNPLNLEDKALLEKQLFECWRDRLQLSADENSWAIKEAFLAQSRFEKSIQNRAKKILEDAKRNSKVVILLLSRPYHLDSGLNHEILDEFQSLGFATITINSIPKDEEFLYPYFKDDLEAKRIKSPFDISDVWQENFSTNSSQKVWGAKFASRCPNVAVVDFSSFKCGHDAPTYAIIDKILSTSHTPHLSLHDIDANKPTGSFKIRIKTFAYTLNEYQKRL